MLLSRVILVLHIYIQFIFVLFSHHTYSSPKKHGSPTLSSTEMSNQLSHNEFTLNENVFQSKYCIFSDNLEEIINILHEKKFNDIDPILYMVLDHSAECEADHSLNSITSIMRHLYKCNRYDAIQKIADQLARKEIIVHDKEWSYKNINILLFTISNNHGDNINILRNMIAAEIVKERTNIKKWTSGNLVNISNRICTVNGDLSKAALSKIINHVFTNIPTLNKWNGYNLKCIINGVCNLKSGSVKTNAFLKISDLIMNSQLLKWQSLYMSSIFFNLSDEYMSLNSSLKNKDTYKEALTHIIRHMETYDFSFSEWTSHQLSEMIFKVVCLESTINVKKIMNKICACVVSTNVNLHKWESKDIALMTQALGSSNEYINKERAIRKIIIFLTSEKTNISKWSTYELMLVFNTVFRINGSNIESVLSKIADNVVSRNTELNNWSTDDLATIAAGLTMHRRTCKHNAVQKIANYVSNTKLNWEDNEKLMIICALSHADNDDCHKVMQDFAHDVSTGTLDLSIYNESQLSRLINAFKNEVGPEADSALEKMSEFFINNAKTCFSRWNSYDLIRVISVFSMRKNIESNEKAINIILNYILEDKYCLSKWTSRDMELLITRLESRSRFQDIQKLIRKTINYLDNNKKRIQNLTVKSLSLRAKGACRLMDHSSEEYINNLANNYIIKINNNKYHSTNDGECGLTILNSLCKLSLVSNKHIRTGVDIASFLEKQYYSRMSEVERFMFYWCITILNFALSERNVSDDDIMSMVKTKVCELVKIIPMFNYNAMDKYTIIPWKIEFMNIEHFGVYSCHESASDLHCSQGVSPYIRDVLFYHIKEKLDHSVEVYKEHAIRLYPIDIFLKSGNSSICIKINEPHHFYKDEFENKHRVIKDRFVDYILEKKGFKTIRIESNHLENANNRSRFIDYINEIL